MSLSVESRNCQRQFDVDLPMLEKAVAAVLQGEKITAATISLAVVDDVAIRALNRQYLDHDYATDVLSFVLEQTEDFLEGEVVVSIDTAATQAKSYGWSLQEELMLYVIHGTLHLAGYDDHSESDRAEMRCLEKRYLETFGILVPRD